ncbi:MAG: hypothetical protein LBD14_04560 [Puniceicoccales bacterium]|jgi:tetratricopeptide (TPR) repeat protein|nr:hypothetical protein [Puniceicoccales bacterium]
MSNNTNENRSPRANPRGETRELWTSPLLTFVALAVLAELAVLVAWNQVSRKKEDAPAKAKALLLSGLTHFQNKDLNNALADYTAVIEMKDAPAEQRALALSIRGATYGEKDERDKALADYTAVIEMKDAPVEQRALALFRRGFIHREKDAASLPGQHAKEAKNAALSIKGLFAQTNEFLVKIQQFVTSAHDNANISYNNANVAKTHADNAKIFSDKAAANAEAAKNLKSCECTGGYNHENCPGAKKIKNDGKSGFDRLTPEEREALGL